MGVTVVGTVGAFTTEVDTAVRCPHIGHTDAQDVFFANLDGFLCFDGKRRISPEVGSQADAVEPDRGVGGDPFKAQEYALGHQLVVIQGETLEVEGAVLGHEQLVEATFPDVGNIHGFGIGGVGCVPAVGNSGIFRIPLHLPVAVKAHDFVHSGFPFIRQTP